MNGLYVPWQAVVDGAELDFELVFGKELDQAACCEIFGDQNAPADIKLSPPMAASIAMLPWLKYCSPDWFSDMPASATSWTASLSTYFRAQAGSATGPAE